MKVTVFSEKELPDAARLLLEESGPSKVFAFHGLMGAGKTTFIQAICRELGVTDVVQSPTFSIINEYRKPSGESVFHFDFYRIGKLEEAYDIGYEDYFFSGAVCLIEWPELISPLLPEDTIHVYITGESARTIETRSQVKGV